ncbi:MAG TPA: hypothetical protein DD979_04220 [Gammaproteobacteria bacterium]|nr:hypothetical protein [Gammaproteobacteria bacterium]
MRPLSLSPLPYLESVVRIECVSAMRSSFLPRYRCVFLGLVLSSVLVLPARAEDLALQSLDVVSSADGVHRTGDVLTEATTGFSSSIHSDRIQQSQLSIGSLIDQEAGAQVRESGGFGGYSEISLRGAGSDQVMVFLDGMLLNDGSGGGVDLSLVDPAQTARIDVYRGSTPLQLGKASLGGAVNILTHLDEAHSRYRVAATAGDFGTYKVSALAQGARDDLDGLISISAAGSANDFELTNNNGTQHNPDDDRVEARENAATAQQSALLKAGRQFSERRRLDGTALFFNKAQEIPTWNNSPNAEATFDTQSWQVRGRWISDDHLNGTLDTATEWYYTHRTETYDDRNNEVGLAEQHDRYVTRTHGISQTLQWQAGASEAGLRLELREERYHRNDKLGHDPDDRSRRQNALANLDVSQRFLQGRLRLTPSARLHWRKSRYRLDDADGTSRDEDFHADPQLGLKYRPTAQLTLKSNVGRYRREPGFFELFGDRGLVLGNPELVAEHGINADVGAEWQSHLEIAGLRALRLQTSAWYNTIDDMIVRTFDARGVGRSSNVASARLRGWELALRATFVHDLVLNLRYTTQDPENRSPNAAFKGKVLPGRDQRALYASLEAPLLGWTLLYDVHMRSGRYYDTANLLPNDDPQIHSLRLTRQSPSGFGISLALNNLTDETVEDFNGYPKPGRAWFITLSYEH